jgi:hypothetical protein
MNNILSIIIITVLFSLSGCTAPVQEPIIFVASDADDQQIAFMKESAFLNIEISGRITMGSAIAPNSIDQIIRALGDPVELNHEVDITNDGATVLSQTNYLRYSGIEFIFPFYDEFVLSRIEITKPDHYLEINGDKLAPGKMISEFSELLPAELKSDENQTINLHVAETDESGNFKTSPAGSIYLTHQSIQIEFNHLTEEITKIVVIRRFN